MNWDKYRVKIQQVVGTLPDLFLAVKIPSQHLYVYENTSVKRSYSISTSKFGIGNREGSFMTPTGVHRITDKIGADAPPFRIFRSREDTGENWCPGMAEENLVLTRILRLEGLEPGVNKGEDIDSYNRYIYIHGTNHEELIGTPMSHGCICMKNNEIIKLFELIPEGTVVVID